MKNRYIKIGISLLIALCFILPTGAILADTGDEAANLTQTIPKEDTKYQQTIDRISPLQRTDGEVIEQATNTQILNVYMEQCGVEDIHSKIPLTGVDPIVNGRPALPFADCYRPVFQLLTTDVPTRFEPEIEIYEVACEDEYCIYETSFEDNARNYLEWVQIDFDCGLVGGYYDGWSWSDARACCGDHSFKSTMYDEYKNMQSDMLQMRTGIDLTQDTFELCDGTILEDVNAQTVNISFDVFVDGEWAPWGSDDYEPLDFFDFYLFDGTFYYWVFPIEIADTSMDIFDFWSVSFLDFAKKSDCPGWWHVWFEIPVSSLVGPLQTHFAAAFYWQSDKERVYEGAYVDCVEITITDESQNKVYQGHSQDWLTEDDVNTPIGVWKFPLDWTGFRETIAKVNCKDTDCGFYRAVCKIKTDDGGYLEPIIIDFEIGEVDINEITDLIIEDDFDHVEVPDGGVLDYPSDAHIKWTYHNGGSVPMYDIPVKASAYTLVEETLASFDMETGFSYYYFIGWETPYLSNDFAWSGTRSLAFNNPDTMHYDSCTDRAYGMLFGDPIDMECIEDVCLDFYYMGKIGPGASFHFIAGAETGGVTLDMRDYWQGLVDNQKTGVEHDSCDENCLGKPAQWLGPMQPICNYACIDLDYVWEQVKPYAIDADGKQTYGLLYGFVLGGSAGYWDTLPQRGVFYMCDTLTEETDWSGVYVDDVTVTAKVMGEKVWEEEIIIPGPIDPCETVTDQFTWEDPDFSCYRVVVEVPGCYPPFGCYGDEEFWFKYSDFCVLEAKEKMTKQDDEDYSDCDPETWCISDVVGNDCGAGLDPETGEYLGYPAFGDHYALATNCDEYWIPADVNDYIALGPVDDDCVDGCAGPIDVSHLYVSGAGGGVAPPCFYEQPIHPDQDSSPGSGPFSETTYGYRTYDNIVAPFDACTVDKATSFGLVVYGNDDPDGNSWYIGMYEDAGGSPGTEFYEDYVTPTGWTFNQIWLGWTCWEIEYDISPVEIEGGDWVSFYMDASGTGERYACNDDDTGYGDGISYQNTATNFFDLAWSLGEPPLLSSGFGLNCTLILDESFEDPYTFPPVGWSTYYYFWWHGPIWGEPSHDGVRHLYSSSSGDSAVTPILDTRDANTLSFWYAVESEYYPQNLEVYADGSLVWFGYGLTNEDYVEVILDDELDPWANDNITIEFYNPGPSSLYGVMVDLVQFEQCIDEGPDIVPEDIWVNFTYQVDMDQGEVIVEYAHFNATDDDCCPPGEEAWTTLGNPITGRMPGLCQNYSEKITVTQTHLCLRIRLDTRGYSEPWGIGFHMHELFIGDIIYDPFDNMTYNFYEDFEDGTLTIPDQPGESENLEWCIDCVRYGEHWTEIGDFEFFCGGSIIPTEVPFGCQTMKFVGTDDYGDGWWYPDCHIDIYVNGVQVVFDFTLPPYDTAYNEVFFDACGGDEIVIDCKISGTSYWPYEMAWYLYDENGTLWASDGVGGTIPYDGETTVNIPVAPFVIFPESYWPAEPINTACVWDTEIEDCYEAYLFGYWMYDIPAGCTITFEVSIDGGNNWFVIAKVEGPAEAGAYEPIPCTMYDLTPFAGNRILVRTHVDNEGAGEGFLFIKDYMIYGKQDMIPPEVAISLSGNLIGGGQYAGPVTVTITATDNKGVKEIHYILDGGAETIVAGDTAVFTVNADGDHTVTAWAVDILGNVGSSDTASFSIDATPPTVEITAPTPGLYLFGNQLLSMSKPFIIGAFTIEATADDAQGVASVEFFLNGDSLGADLDAPYSIYCAEKNMGAAEITAVATDGVGNSAEDSLDVTYYKFL